MEKFNHINFQKVVIILIFNGDNDCYNSGKEGDLI